MRLESQRTGFTERLTLVNLTEKRHIVTDVNFGTTTTDSTTPSKQGALPGIEESQISGYLKVIL